MALTVLETWRRLQGLPYEVSDQGRVRRLNSKGARVQPDKAERRERLVHGSANERGYRRIQLWCNGTVEVVQLSRLVATVFVPNPHELPQVRHLDFDVTNNAAANLQWCTFDENIALARAAGRFDAAVSPARAKVMNPDLAHLAYLLRVEGMTYREISDRLDVGAKSIANVCQGKTWRHPARPPLVE